MSVNFYQPKALINNSGATLTSNFSNDDPDHLQTLLSNNVNALPYPQSYVSATQRDAAPSTFGAWIPVVANQDDLDKNFSLVRNGGGSSGYFFFKESGSGVGVLSYTSDLASGYDECIPVEVEDQPTAQVTTLNIGAASLQMNDSDGPVILIGILDTGDPGSNR